MIIVSRSMFSTSLLFRTGLFDDYSALNSVKMIAVDAGPAWDLDSTPLILDGWIVYGFRHTHSSSGRLLTLSGARVLGLPHPYGQFHIV